MKQETKEKFWDIWDSIINIAVGVVMVCASIIAILFLISAFVLLFK